MHPFLFAPAIKPERLDSSPNQAWECFRSWDVYVGLGRCRFEFTFLFLILLKYLFHYSSIWSSCIPSSFLSVEYRESLQANEYHEIRKLLFYFVAEIKLKRTSSLTKGNPTIQLVSSYMQQMMRMRNSEKLLICNSNHRMTSFVFCSFSWMSQDIIGFPRRLPHGCILLLYLPVFPALIPDIHIIVIAWIPMTKRITSISNRLIKKWHLTLVKCLQFRSNISYLLTVCLPARKLEH